MHKEIRMDMSDLSEVFGAGLAIDESEIRSIVKIDMRVRNEEHIIQHRTYPLLLSQTSTCSVIWQRVEVLLANIVQFGTRCPAFYRSPGSLYKRTVAQPRQLNAHTHVDVDWSLVSSMPAEELTVGRTRSLEKVTDAQSKDAVAI